MKFTGLLCSNDQNAVFWIKIIFDRSNLSEENTVKIFYCTVFSLIFLFVLCLLDGHLSKYVTSRSLLTAPGIIEIKLSVDETLIWHVFDI